MITFLHGDCLDLLPTLPRVSVQCVVTSPPYFRLRDYGIEPSDWPVIEYAPMAGLPPVHVPYERVCLGLESNVFSYIGHLVHVFRLVRDVLRDDGVLWLNLGDSYAAPSKWGGKSGNKNYASAAGGIPRSRVGRNPMPGMEHADVRDAEHRAPQPGMKDKDLYGVPWRAAMALQADGWYLRSDVTWEKPNGMCENVEDRPTKTHEYFFLLSKSRYYFYDADAVREPLKPKTLTTYGSKHRPQGNDDLGNVKSDNWGRTVNERKPRLNADGAPVGANRRSVWRFAVGNSGADGHYATFPEGPIDICVKAGTSPRACEWCGAPWAHIVEKESTWQERKATDATAGNLGTSETYQRNVHGKGMSHDLGPKAVRDLGSQPTCKCEDNTGLAQCTVLDPFFGSGTVGRVAERYGRHCIGIEKKAEYIELSDRRTNGVQIHMDALL